MQSVGVIHGNAVLEVATHSQDIGEENGMADAPFRIVLGPSLEHPALDDSVLELVEANLLMGEGTGHLAAVTAVSEELTLQVPPAQALQHVIGEPAVQPLHVHRIQGVLHYLQPVARYDRGADIPQHVVPHEQVPTGQ